jgi:sporulation protein YlmC with PRC-barrel domain
LKALLRGSDLVGLPIVTIAGEDIAEVRDVLFDPAGGRVLGFTLNRRGRLAKRMKDTLDRDHIAAVGPHAVIVEDDDALGDERLRAEQSGGSGNVLGDRVITDTGVQVGTVTDVVVDGSNGSVVGYEVAPASEPSGRQGRRSYLPLPDVGAVSGEALVVPAAAADYITADFAGFAEAVDRYRASIRGQAG